MEHEGSASAAPGTDLNVGRSPPRFSEGLERESGLTAAEAADRMQCGLANAVAAPTSRSIADILRKNLFTPFNAVLGLLFVGMLLVGPPQDALFGGVVIANVLIGVVQELRAKRLLDRLVIIATPTVSVLRDGASIMLPANALVLDDVVNVRPGDQVVADAVLLQAEGLEVSEAHVSGEASPVPKMPGDNLVSGSFIVAGSGRGRITKVGRESFAGRLAVEARVFKLTRSELRVAVDRIIRAIGWALLPVAPLLFFSQLRVHGEFASALRATIAGLAPMVPEGLVLLTSATLAVAMVRLGRKHALIQDLGAVEALARVDVVCIDKTGTLTDGDPAVVAIEVLDPIQDVAAALGALAAHDDTASGSLRALAAGYPAPLGWQAVRRAAFSSARRWSAATFADRGTWVLGAPDALIGFDILPLAARQTLERHTALGHRVLLLAHREGILADKDVPKDLRPVALVALGEHIRSDAGEILRYFAAQGITVKILSGDNPITVGAVAQRAGMQVGDGPVDARALPGHRLALADLVEERDVFGRVAPEQKRAIITALQERRHVVAMMGDGVNDVLALKQADIAIAMGSGASAARAVSQLVLTDNRFDVLPAVIAEGRRVIANVERVGVLFLTKTVFVLAMALAVAGAGLPFPFLSRQLTLIGSLTIGIPACLLSLVPHAERAQPGFLDRVGRIAGIAGITAAAAAFAGYAFILRVHRGTELQAQSAATMVLFVVSLWVVTVVARPLVGKWFLLIGATALVFALVLAIPNLRGFFALEPLIPLHLTTSLLLAGTAIVTLEVLLKWLGAGFARAPDR